MQQKGFFCWHVHHERILLEWCYDYDERAEYIRTEKPPHERALRLRLFQPVKGQLPQEVVEAGNTYSETWNALGEARNVHFGTRKVDDEAGKSYDEAQNAYGKAGKAYFKVLSSHKGEIEALHADECRPDCPWDGMTIFPAA